MYWSLDKNTHKLKKNPIAMDSHRDYDYSNNEMDRSFEDYSDVWNESTAATVQLTIRIFI